MPVVRFSFLRIVEVCRRVCVECKETIVIKMGDRARRILELIKMADNVNGEKGVIATRDDRK